MSMRDGFASALRDADAELATRKVGAHVDARVRTSAVQRPAKHVWLLAALVPMLAIVLWMVGRESDRFARPAAQTLAGWSVSEASPDFESGANDRGRVEVTSGSAIFSRAGWGRMSVVAPAAFQGTEGRDVRLFAGRVVLDVAHQTSWSTPARVLVSSGAIEIVGTRFTVNQRARGGEVALHDGAIRFVDDAGTVMLSPGQVLVWPRSASPPQPDAGTSTPGTSPSSASSAAASPSAASTSAASTSVAPKSSGLPASAPVTSADASALMRRVEELRSRGRYEEAAELLRQRDEELPAATRERLSFERGSLLTYQRKDKARACAHWTTHVARYPNGRYRADVQQAVNHLGCNRRKEKP